MTPTARNLTRRRVLQLFAASAAVAGASATAQGGTLHHWRGIALGADAKMTLRHESAAEAERIFKLAAAEIERLERIFSLYRPDSALSRLNREGILRYPPAEMLEVLSICGGVHEATEGAFDPAIQALWAYQAEIALGAATPDQSHFQNLLTASGWRRISFNADEVSLASPAAALTLNGVAQGYVTDRVAALMRANGMTNVLVGLGEIAAIGRRSPAEPWRVGIAGSGEIPAGEVDLENDAIATSAPLATTFDEDGHLAHILDPRTGAPVRSPWRQVSVLHPTATIADALSTGLSILDAHAVERALQRYPSTRAIIFDVAGRRHDFGRAR